MTITEKMLQEIDRIVRSYTQSLKETIPVEPCKEDKDRLDNALDATIFGSLKEADYTYFEVLCYYCYTIGYNAGIADRLAQAGDTILKGLDNASR